jgi:hypothetical protein
MDSNMVRMVRTSVQQGRTQEMIQQFMGGGGGGGLGGPAQAAGMPAWVERPGEGAVAGARGRGGPPAAGAAASPASAMQELFGAFRGVPGALLGRGGRGGGGAAPMVQTGDYLVTFVYGDVRERQVLRVERDAAITGASGFGVEDERDDQDDTDRSH